MKKLSAILILIVIGFGQINWEIEIVDSVLGTPYDFQFNSLSLDTSEIPHVVYNKSDFCKIIYASRVGGGWQKEVVESGLFYYYYGLSLIFDANNISHLSYYRKDDSLNKTYICYARRDTAGWQIEAVDSSNGYLGNYFLNFNSSIDLDTSDLPGIAYIAWNVEDSLHYVKYAHYNGIDWDTSIVARDTTWHHRYPLDYSPSLKFDRESTPHIAFYRFRSDTHTDTLKIAHYDDSLSSWIVDPVLCNIQGSIPVSLVLDSQDYPYIAHTVDIGLYCTWWDGITWHSEYTGADLGWIGIRIVLDLDSLDNPHIAYLPEPLIGRICYCYKEDNVWHLCGWIESDSSAITIRADISFALDNNDQPHVCYPVVDIYFKYAKGTFTGIEENNGTSQLNIALICIPSLTKKNATLRYTLPQETKISLSLYDNLGRLVKNIYAGERAAGTYSQKVSLKDLPCGVYHLLLKTPGKTITRKIVKLE